MEENVVGDMPSMLKMVLALVFVLGLMGGLALILRQLGLSGRVGPRGKKARLGLIESLPLDAKRRLVIIERDNVQHLVILGPNSETVVESDIDGIDTVVHESFDE